MDAPFWVLVSCLIAIGTVPSLVLAVLFYMAARFRQKERERVDADGGPCECGCHYQDGEDADEW